MRKKTNPFIVLLLFFLTLFFSAQSQPTIAVPERSPNAISGSAFMKEIQFLPKNEREGRVIQEVLSGNIPSFLRQLMPVTIKRDTITLVFFALPDYLSVGSDSDYFRIPLTPVAAQQIATQLALFLPTSLLVDYIYESAPVKLSPKPIPPSDSMTTVSVFWKHHTLIQDQLDSIKTEITKRHWVAGHKKDVILSNKILTQTKVNVPKPVVIYGWHTAVGNPIQPVYNGHGQNYVDYSHGIRFVHSVLLVNNREYRIEEVLRSKQWCDIISNEGRIEISGY
jgi:hypothetical protein